MKTKLQDTLVSFAGAVLFAGALSFPLSAAATPPPLNLQFLTSPLPSASFVSGKTDSRLQLMYLKTSGKGFNLKGIGANLAWRKGFNDALAGDFLVGVVYATGTVALGQYGVNDTSVSYVKDPPKDESDFIEIDLQADLELQLINTRSMSVISYAGLAFPITHLNPDPDTTFIRGVGDTYSLSPGFNTIMYGIPLGLKAAINLGNAVQFSPSVGLVDFIGGNSQAVYTWPDHYTPKEYHLKIDPFVSTTAGGELTVIPWGLTLGVIYQNSPASAGSRDSYAYNLKTETKMIYASLHFGGAGTK